MELSDPTIFGLVVLVIIYLLNVSMVLLTLTPYNYTEEPDSLDTRHVLEILQVFLKKKLLRANVTDLLKTREAVLNLIGALFRHCEYNIIA